MINQIDDNGAVIGYQPYLSYNKDLNKADSSKAISSVETDNDEDNTVKEPVSSSVISSPYSKTLEALKNNLPSKTLKDILYSKDTIRNLIDGLSKAFKANKLDDYNNISSLVNAIDVKDDEYINNFINNYNNISSTTVPEIIGNLYDALKRQEEIYSLLKHMYYGTDNKEQEDYNQIDIDYIRHLQEYEISNPNKINYLAIAYDSKLNKIVSYYCYGLNKSCLNAFNIKHSIEFNKSNSLNNTTSNVLKDIYSDVNNKISLRKNNMSLYNNVGLTKKAVYNYYSKRNDLISLYNLIIDNDCNMFIGDTILKYKDRLDNVLVNVAKSLYGYAYNMDKLNDLIQYKTNIMSIYKNVTNNS